MADFQSLAEFFASLPDLTTTDEATLIRNGVEAAKRINSLPQDQRAQFGSYLSQRMSQQIENAGQHPTSPAERQQAAQHQPGQHQSAPTPTPSPAPAPNASSAAPKPTHPMASPSPVQPQPNSSPAMPPKSATATPTPAQPSAQKPADAQRQFQAAQNARPIRSPGSFESAWNSSPDVIAARQAREQADAAAFKLTPSRAAE